MPCYTYMFAYERCSHSDIKAAACDDRQCAHNEDEWRICDTKLRVSFHGKCERCVDHEAAAEESARRAHNSRIQALIRNQPTASPKTQAVNEGIEDREFFVRRLREEKLEAIRSEIGRAREWTGNYAKALYFLQYGLDKMKSDHEAWVAHRAQGRARLKGELDTALARQRDRYEEGIKETDDNLAEIARKRSRLSEWDVTDQSVRAAAVPDEAYDAMRRSLEQSQHLTPVWLTVLVDPTRTRDQLIEHHAQLTLTRQGQELAGWESSYAFSSSALEVNVASPIDQLLQQTEPL